MSATAVAWRHFVSRCRMTLHDPLALGLLAFAGLVTVPLWGFSLGIDPRFARFHPWPRGEVTFMGDPGTAVRLAIGIPDLAVVSAQVLWAALVAAALGQSTMRGWPASSAQPMRALPIGPRARAVADVLALFAFVVAARVAVLWLGGVGLGRMLFGHASLASYPEVEKLVTILSPAGGHVPQALAYASSFVLSTILGTLLALPLVLAWSTTARLDARGLSKPVLATLLVAAAASVGAMAHVASAVLVSAGVSMLVLARLDDGSRDPSHVHAGPLQRRKSDGPLVQFGRDAWRGALRTLWPILLLAVVVPLAPAVVGRAAGFDLGRGILGPYPLLALAGVAAVLQFLFLLGLAFFPFGIPLISSAAAPSGLFSGAFLRAWGILPVARLGVLRAVYVHGLIAAALAWLLFLGHARLLGTSPAPALYELPGVFLLAGIVLCEAVGDRRRGLLAVGALVAFQMGLPLGFVLLQGLLGNGSRFTANETPLWIAGPAVGLLGALPPLVHLRDRSSARSAQA